MESGASIFSEHFSAGWMKYQENLFSGLKERDPKTMAALGGGILGSTLVIGLESSLSVALAKANNELRNAQNAQHLLMQEHVTRSELTRLEGDFKALSEESQALGIKSQFGEDVFTEIDEFIRELTIEIKIASAQLEEVTRELADVEMQIARNIEAKKRWLEEFKRKQKEILHANGFEHLENVEDAKKYLENKTLEDAAIYKNKIEPMRQAIEQAVEQDPHLIGYQKQERIAKLMAPLKEEVSIRYKYLVKLSDAIAHIDRIGDAPMHGVHATPMSSTYRAGVYYIERRKYVDDQRSAARAFERKKSAEILKLEHRDVYNKLSALQQRKTSLEVFRIKLMAVPAQYNKQKELLEQTVFALKGSTKKVKEATRSLLKINLGRSAFVLTMIGAAVAGVVHITKVGAKTLQFGGSEPVTLSSVPHFVWIQTDPEQPLDPSIVIPIYYVAESLNMWQRGYEIETAHGANVAITSYCLPVISKDKECFTYTLY